MIQSGHVRSIAYALVLFGATARAASVDPGIVAVYWEPPGQPAAGTAARAAFAEAVRPLGARFVDATAPAPAPSKLAARLEAAQAAYAQFAFADAVAQLDELAHAAEASGGGELGSRQLSEIFLYRGLARMEAGAAEAAWDDLVRAARLDPARIVDPARFPPRAVTAYKRAAAEAAALPRAELELAVPAGAQVRVDGAPASGRVALPLGAHFVSAMADGCEPWAGMVAVASVKQTFAPPLPARKAPDGDTLLAQLNGERGQRFEVRRLIVGALERAPVGWRFVVRDTALPDGKLVSESVALGEAPVTMAVQGVVRRLAPLPPPEPAGRPRWQFWAVAGAAVVLAGLSLTLLVASRGSSSPSVEGDLGRWR
jgi:hypothetical protein